MPGANRILTTHVGSLPRPTDLLDLMKARIEGRLTDVAAYDARVRGAVAEIVRQQVDVALDIVGDGELSKQGFFEARPGKGKKLFAAEVAAFPEYYEGYFKRAMLGGSVAPILPMFCVGPVTYRGQAALKTDLDNLRAACDAAGATTAFVPSTAPSGAGENAYYKGEEEFLFAVGEALREEYLAIVEAGFLVQIDDPFLSDIFVEPDLTRAQMDKRAEAYVASVNHALRGIPPEKVRFHTCYGINEGPRIHEAALADVAAHMLRINAGYYSFEAANCRHEHEYHLWENVKLPAGKTIIPGVITHASNIVEHPRLIAERIVRFARLVGRENVIAGADCGFSSQACYHTEVHPKVMWEKFRALVAGARLATKQLWG